MVELFLLAAALLPAALLCIYVYKKDSAEPEPPKLLLSLLAFGALSTLPAMIYESIASAVLESSFEPTSLIYNFIYAFFGVALAEEGSKYFFLRWRTAKNKNFNSLFDGLIYAVFVSLGFAALENILYAFQSGFAAAFFRFFTAVPGHMFFAVFMGYYYSLWHINERARQIESVLYSEGFLPPTDPRIPEDTTSRYSALFAPVLVHGFYDFCLFVGTDFLFLVDIAFIIFLYVFCFRRIKKMARFDRNDAEYAMIIVRNYHPRVFSNRNRPTELPKM